MIVNNAGQLQVTIGERLSLRGTLTFTDKKIELDGVQFFRLVALLFTDKETTFSEPRSNRSNTKWFGMHQLGDSTFLGWSGCDENKPTMNLQHFLRNSNGDLEITRQGVALDHKSVRELLERAQDMSIISSCATFHQAKSAMPLPAPNYTGLLAVLPAEMLKLWQTIKRNKCAACLQKHLTFGADVEASDDQQQHTCGTTSELSENDKADIVRELLKRKELLGKQNHPAYFLMLV